MDTDQLKATLVGFAGAIAVLALLLYFVGVGDLMVYLGDADVGTVGLVVAVTVAWLFAWGLALRTVLGVLGRHVSPIKTFLVFSGAMFNNNVTPFGQAGGEPVTALLISEVTDSDYGTGLAAIASVDTLNFVPSIMLALLGMGYFATQTTFNARLESASIVVVGLTAVVVGGLVFGWRNHERVETAVVGVGARLARFAGEYVPRVSDPGREAVEKRVGHFFEAIERVATNPRGLVLALTFSALGWALQMSGLWLAFQAIGEPVSLGVVMFVVPIGAIAGMTPLPGGAGGIEAVLVFLLVAAPLDGVTKSVALAAVVIYRGAVFWVPVVLGGIVMGTVGAGARAGP
ncbi:flippase-like domain-containing protein [Halolamina sp. CBA1230]|uniref:lysylphosphatidylglycerol synthase transmembrane domain-containing protein n=1 Tax=Halolamina sp. CBA1230 TaxID=1853690 RepID=UPI0009A21415|nr:lysylphosphatidylglycerol synthase transmembrane domain-containing protein [Halolamina sp. CBA1230]QKY21057.1 flippase-like domain-containing protein [Halolamina sp. CBA1230]